MSEDKDKVRLFRKPRAPKLEKLDLTKVKEPEEVTPMTETSETSVVSTDRDRELVQPSAYLNANHFNIAGSTTSSKSSGKTEKIVLLPVLAYTNTPSPSKLNRDKLIIINEEDSDEYQYAAANKSYFKSSTEDANAKTEPTTVETNQYMKSFTNAKQKTMASIRSCKSTQSNSLLKSLVKPFKPRGPDPLPIRPIKYRNGEAELRKAYYDEFCYDDANFEMPKQTFMLNDFLRDNRIGQHIIDSSFSSAYVSNYNYNQICKILADKIENERSEESKYVHVQTLVPDVEPISAPPRKPIRQTMVEMASYLKNELSQKTGATLKTKFNPVSKWQRMNGAQTELVIFEDKTAAAKEEEDEANVDDENQITISKLAVVDSLLRNGLALSLKAHFIDKLPDINSLKKTLIYINLSFNNFQVGRFGFVILVGLGWFNFFFI